MPKSAGKKSRPSVFSFMLSLHVDIVNFLSDPLRDLNHLKRLLSLPSFVVSHACHTDIRLV